MIHEDYHSLVVKNYQMSSPVEVSVYVNPTYSDIKELYTEITSIRTKRKYTDNFVYCRFLIYKKQLYIWYEEYLHSDMIKHLGLKFSTSNTEKINISEAFLGIGELQKGQSKIRFDTTNQQLNDEYDKVIELCGTILEKYFTNIEHIETRAAIW